MALIFRTTARRVRHVPVRTLPIVLLALAASGSLLTLLAPRAPGSHWLGSLSPLDLLDSDPVLAGLSIMASAAIAVGLLRGKRSSWWLAVATFAAALFVQGAALSDPLESVVLGGALAVLIADRHRYRVETRASWQPWLLALVLVATLAGIAETALIIAATGHWPTPLGALSEATTALGNLFGVGDGLANSILGVAGRGGLFAALLLAARLPIALSAVGVLVRIPEPEPDPTVRHEAQAIARRHGHGALLPFQLGEDKLICCPPDTDACIVYGLAGRTAIVLGDPIADSRATSIAFEAFLRRSRRLDRSVSVYQASDGMRPALIQAGFRLFRIGREAIIELPSFELAGSRRANLRHTIARARRGGGAVCWFPDGLSGDDGERMIGDLVAVDAAWHRHAGPRMGFTMSELDLDDLRSLPVSVALDPACRPVAFTTFRPTGSDGGWVLDLMRRKPAELPGMVEWSIAEAALGLKAMGAPTLSLGLAPLAGLSPREGPCGERLLALAARLVLPWYDVRGLAFFKAKFDPRWEPRYAAVSSWWNLPGMTLALLRLHLRRDCGRRAAGCLVQEEGDATAPRTPADIIAR